MQIQRALYFYVVCVNRHTRFKNFLLGWIFNNVLEGGGSEFSNTIILVNLRFRYITMPFKNLILYVRFFNAYLRRMHSTCGLRQFFVSSMTF